MTPLSITDLINLWPSRRTLAEEIGATEAAVHKWAANSRIPSDWQARVVRAAQKRGHLGITAAWMIEAHEPARGAA